MPNRARIDTSGDNNEVLANRFAAPALAGM